MSHVALLMLLMLLMCYSPNMLTIECFESKLSYDRSERGSNYFHVENIVLGYWGDLLMLVRVNANLSSKIYLCLSVDVLNFLLLACK